MLADEQTHRYLLWRAWSGALPSICVFIGLNPSTADATQDDPTSRRCIGYTKRWGYDALVMVNLFAYRSVHPGVLRAVADPIGQYNDAVIDCVVDAAALIVCAWGNHGLWYDRSSTVVARLTSNGHRLFSLGTTQSGEPVHPLYQRRDVMPMALTNASVQPESLRALENRKTARLVLQQRMLSLRGNASMDNLAPIIGAVRRKLNVDIEVHSVKTA